MATFLILAFCSDFDTFLIGRQHVFLSAQVCGRSAAHVYCDCSIHTSTTSLCFAVSAFSSSAVHLQTVVLQGVLDRQNT